MSETEHVDRPIPDDLAELLRAWISTKNWNESQAMLTTNAERLLSDEAYDLLAGLSLAASQAGDEHAAVLMQHQAILEAARSTSIDAVYAELLKPSPLTQALRTLPDDLRQGVQALIGVRSSSELLECVQQHPLLLTSEATAAIDTLLETLRAAGEEHMAAGIEERYATLKQVIAGGAMGNPSSELVSLLLAWINTETWDASKALLQANAESLLSDAALDILAALQRTDENQDERAKQTLLLHRTLLEMARRESIDAAYADPLQPSPVIAALNALWQANSPDQLQYVLNQHPVLLEEQTWQALTTIVEDMEQNGKAELAQAMRLRLDLLRDLREHQGQAAAARYAEQHEDERLTEVTAINGGMAGYSQYGNVQLNQTTIEGYELPARRWQRPARQLLLKAFVGRQRELNELKQRLRGGENLTITSQTPTAMLWGMAGIGKTFLARRLSIEVDAQFPGGVIWVKLGPEVDTAAKAAAVLPTIASAAFGGDKPVRTLDPETVRSWLEEMAPGRLLVVFDDAWSQDALQFLNQALPNDAVRIVTTRRAHVAQTLGGYPYQLDCFDLEDGKALLESRLQGLPLEAYQEQLKELVTLLGGHALALDIAAGLIRKPSHVIRVVEDLKQDIGRGALDRLDLSDQIEAEDLRDNNLKHSLSLSYHYMPLEQRRCFRALGAFAPDSLITPKAAAAVWRIEDLRAARDMLDTLDALALINEAEEASDLSYQQHSLLHTYASALLRGEEEETGVCWTHASYYTQLVRQTEIPHYSLLDLALPNILSALEWTGKHEPMLCSQLIETAFQFLLVRGQSQQLEQHLPVALAAATMIGEKGRQANLLQSLGDLERRLGNIDQARAHYDAALPLFRAERARLGEANVYLSLAVLHLAAQEWLPAKTWYERALPLFVAVQDPLGQANTLIDLGRVRFVLGPALRKRPRDRKVDKCGTVFSERDQVKNLTQCLLENLWN